MRQKLMIIGAGSLGGWVLELLVRIPGLSRLVDIVVCDVDEELGIRRVNSALLGAQFFDIYPAITFKKMDLFEKDSAAEILAKERPTVIFSNVTLQSWWVLYTLPQETCLELDKAKFGPWLPMHLALVYNLMQAIKSAGINCHVLNASFPDAVNCILEKKGFPVTAGIGNIDNLAPMVRLGVARKLDVPVADVDLYLYLPHFVSSTVRRDGSTEGAPYLARAFVCGEDVSGNIDFDGIFKEAKGELRHPEGNGLHPVVGSSAVRCIMALLKDSREKVHSPGPAGLPGGYPVRLSASRGAEVLLPGLSLSEAVEVNKQAQVFDGIKEIKEDGTTVFTDWAYEVMKNALAYDCRELKPEDSEERARELQQKFTAYVK